jgi:NitT/TauT family transport system substrate-binding protein
MTLSKSTPLIVAVMLLASPCDAQQLAPWRNALIQPKADAGFYLMASKGGFFEKEGLKVETLEVKDDTIGFKALMSGDVDSYLGTAGALAAVARGAGVKFVGCPWHGIPYVVLGRSGISRIEDLKGKSIAASAPGTPIDIVARAALAMFKVPASQVTFAAVGADRERYNALLAGVVDAAVVSNEYLPLLHDGRDQVVPLRSVAPGRNPESHDGRHRGQARRSASGFRVRRRRDVGYRAA